MNNEANFEDVFSKSEQEFKKLYMLHRAKFIKMVEKAGIFPGQVPILVFIEYNNGCTQKEIANAFQFRAASITDALKRMEKAGFILRCQDKHDLRITRVSLTEKGKEQMKVAIDISHEMERCCFVGFQEEEKNLFLSYVERVCHNLEHNERGIEC